MNKSAIFLLLTVIILIFFSLVFGLYEVRIFKARASISSATLSIENSYVFITPLKASANGQEKIRLTVFALDNQGLGVMGKNVFIAPNSSLTIDTIQGLTDSSGKAYFDISSSKAGEYYLEIKIDDKALNQRAHLSFN